MGARRSIATHATPWVEAYSGPPDPAKTPVKKQQAAEYERILAENERKCAESPRLKSKIRRETREALLAAARRFGDVAGKWVLFPFSSKADAVWTKVDKATRAGKLSHHAKISTTARGEGPRGVHAMCVYVRDWRDEQEVKRVLKKLQRMGIAQRREDDGDPDRMAAFFKPDVFTRLGVYHRGGSTEGSKGLDGTLYRIDDLS